MYMLAVIALSLYNAHLSICTLLLIINDVQNVNLSIALHSALCGTTPAVFALILCKTFLTINVFVHCCLP